MQKELEKTTQAIGFSELFWEKTRPFDFFKSNSQCLGVLMGALHSRGKTCPKCGEFMALMKSRPYVFGCPNVNCRAQTSVRSGLFLEGANKPLTVWFNTVTLLYCERSISDSMLAELLNVERSTARRMKERILPLFADLQKQNDPNVSLVRAILKATEQETHLNYHTVAPMYRLICGDSYVELPKIPDKSAGLIVADVPYNQRQADWDGKVNFEPLAEQYARIVNEEGNVIIFMSFEQIGECLAFFGKYFKYYQQFYYEKTNPDYKNTERYGRLASAVENALIFWNDSQNHTFNSKGNIRNIYRCAKASPKEREDCGGHPTPKPLELMKHLIKIYSKEGDLVMDSHMGSATTGAAAVLSGRRFLGIEADPYYCDVSAKRLKKCGRKRVNPVTEERSDSNDN
jgi:DNA modification methylase